MHHNASMCHSIVPSLQLSVVLHRHAKMLCHCMFNYSAMYIVCNGVISMLTIIGIYVAIYTHI